MGWILVAAVVVVAVAIVGVMLWILSAREREARRRFRILAEVAEVSDAGGSLEETIEAICAILVPELADICAIDLIGEDEVRRAGVRVGPGAPPGIERGLAERPPSLPEAMVEGDRGRSLTPRFFDRLSDDDLKRFARNSEDLEFLRSLGIRSAVTVALNARGRVSGTLTLSVAWSGRRYQREDARFAWILSGRVALALDNCGLFADLEQAERARAEIAETLQRGLLPPPLPHIAGWSIAAMYRPAGAENEVGGDFYDVFRVADGWMLVLGDVTGSGARAASITAVARYTLRTAATLTADPVLAIATLNRALLARGGSALCSVAALVISTDPTRPVRMAIAGHPPPLLIDGEAVDEVAAAGPVLGAFEDSGWEITETGLEPGQQLVTVTDGIFEAQGPQGRFGEDRLRAELSGASDPARIIQGIEGTVTAFTEGVLDDDMAVLTITPERTTAEGPGSPAIDHEREAGGGVMELVERLYDAFNRRDPSEISAVCDDEMEFFPVVTAEAVGREAPYAGPDGLSEYLADAAEVWAELLVTPGEVEVGGEQLLVRGRVYARSREFGIRDMPAAWIWQVRDGRFIRGEVFRDPSSASERFLVVTA